MSEATGLFSFWAIPAMLSADFCSVSAAEEVT